MNGPVIEHWLVAVARTAKLPGADQIHVDSDTPTADAWSLVGMALRIDATELARRVSSHFKIAIADLEDRDPHAEKLIPRAVAKRLNVLPLRYNDRNLIFASADPVGMEAERELTAVAGRTVHPEVADPTAIRAAVERVYGDATETVHEVPRLMPEDRGGPHVLVVDDDTDMRMLLRSALEGRGFRVSEAEDGTDALLALARTDDAIHLVTLDLQMKELHGLETLRRMRTSVRTAHIPVIVATGSQDSAVEMELFTAGADDYVVKPIDPPRFVLRVLAVLRRRGGPQPAVRL